MSAAWKVLLLAIAGVVAALLCLVFSRRPVIFRLTEPGEIVRPSVTVFNPLRNRLPERVAENVLIDLRRGAVGTAMRRVGGAQNADITEKEQRYRLRRWKLVDRLDDRNTVTLYYRTDRGVSGQLDSEIIIVLRRQAADWLVSDYRPVY